MEDLTLALITLTSFVLLFVVAIFADRAGAEAGEAGGVAAEPILIPVDEPTTQHTGQSSHFDADVA